MNLQDIRIIIISHHKGIDMIGIWSCACKCY